jgi:hypothetical protein
MSIFKLFTALRQSLEDDLKACQQFPELTGDVRLLRFLRGNKMNVSVVCILSSFSIKHNAYKR